MSTLIRNQRIVADDFVVLDNDAPLPRSGKFIVSLERWQKDGESLRTSPLTVGVSIPNTADLSIFWPLLQDRPLIALQFPAFGDGRAYSQAHLLRLRYRFSGEIRATGAAVVRDQINNMMRSGINSFLLRSDQDPQTCLNAYNDFTLAYQDGTDTAMPIVPQQRRRQQA
jgi:uncharacterized protein (DUF934 family)